MSVVSALAGCEANRSSDGSLTGHSNTTQADPSKSTQAGPPFPGAGTSAAGSSLSVGTPVVSCDAPRALPAGTFGPAPDAVATQTCFYTKADPVTPAATVEWITESAPVGDLIHVRLTLNPDFVDNTYGDNAIGWPARGMGKPMAGPGGMMPMPGPAHNVMQAHTFKDLVESDHAEFKLTDTRGLLVLTFDADYISPDPRAPSGYASLGVSGGEGKILHGNASDIAGVSTSLDRDLNACGLGSYLDSSPATDADYTPNPAAPKWDYRVVYDVWVTRSAFGAAGFGAASVDFVHASPSKASTDTLTVEPGPCCVEIDSPSCSNYTPPPPVVTCTNDCPIGI